MNRTVAHIFSLLFHPLLILTSALLFLLAVNPYAFSVRDLADRRAVLLLLSVFTTSFMLPAFGVGLMKPLGLIKSLQLEDKMERIGPYILSGVFYLWLYKNLASGEHAPPLFNSFVLGTTIALFFAFFINIFTKISVHAVGMGGLVAMVLVTSRVWDQSVFNLPMMLPATPPATAPTAAPVQPLPPAMAAMPAPAAAPMAAPLTVPCCCGVMFVHPITAVAATIAITK